MSEGLFEIMPMLTNGIDDRLTELELAVRDPNLAYKCDFGHTFLRKYSVVVQN
jgi:hypothetical protein